MKKSNDEKNIIKKNILFFFHASDLNNGATRSMVDVITGLIKNDDVNIVVLYPDKRGSAIDYLELKGIKTYRVMYGRWDYPINLKRMKKIMYFAKSFIKQFIGIINLLKIKNIIKKENINIIYSNTSVIYEGALISKLTGIKHIWHIREFGEEDHKLKNMYGEGVFYKYMNMYTDKIVFISNSIEEKFKKHIKDSDKINVIYNDISKDFINPKSNYNFNDKLKLTIIGTIQEGKGQLEVTEAVKILRDENIYVELHIAGRKQGEYYNKIEKYILDNNLQEDVIFDGFITNVNEYRSKFDIGVVASSNEAFGRVTIEGMLSGLVIIGADSAGTKELIQNESNGILYKLHSPSELAEKIKYLDQNRKKLMEISINGYNDAVKKFTNGNASKRIYDLINELVREEK